MLRQERDVQTLDQGKIIEVPISVVFTTTT